MSTFLLELWESQAFQNGFWIFMGIVAGALIQYGLSRIQIRSGAKNALRVLKTEIELNLDEYQRFKEQIASLKELISAGQLDESELLISMEGFDFSAVSPLIQQGFFHFMLGADKSKKYFAFARFFNNNNANVLTEVLRKQHLAEKSIPYLSYIQKEAEDLAKGISDIQDAKLRRGLSLGNR